jgi:uncharacterized membrane protein HdeD (DUF308 family)
MAGSNTVAKDMEWALVLRGIITLIFGIAAVFWPGITLVTLVYLFSAFVLASGIVTAIRGMTAIGDNKWWFLEVIMGFIELGVGVYLLRHVHVSFATLILLIGFSLIIRGVVDVVGSLMDGSTAASSRTLSVIAGLIALLAGIIVLFQPVASGVAFVWILGLYALIVGPLQIALAHDVRKQLS